MADATTQWQISIPTYMRDSTNNSVLPYYVFTVINGPIYSESPITTSATLTKCLLSALLSPAMFGPYLMNLYSTFLNVHGKRFAKPYTPAQLIKATKHVVNCEMAEEELEWTLRVKQIEVKNGAFYLIWSAEGKALQIQLEEETVAETPVAQATATEATALTPDNSLEELNVNELPLKEEASTFRLSLPRDTGSDIQLQERRMVETARIQAKIAHYKAQKAIAMYVQKYGDLDDLFSDSSDEDLDSDD